MAKKYGIGVGLVGVAEIKSDFLKLMTELQTTANNNKIQLIDKETLKQMSDITKSVDDFKNKNKDTKIFNTNDIDKQKNEVMRNIKEVEDKLKVLGGGKGNVALEANMKKYDVKSDIDNAERFRSITKLQKEVKDRNKDAIVSFTTVEDAISNTVTKVVAQIKRGTKEAETLNYELMKIRHFDENGKKTTSYNGYVQTKDTTKTSNDAFDLETQKKLYSELNALIKEEYSLKAKLVGVQNDDIASGRINSEISNINRKQEGLRETLATKKLINAENEKEVSQNINKGKLQVGLKEDTARLALQKKTYSELNALIKEEYALKVKLAGVKDSSTSKDVLNDAIKANKERQNSAEEVLKTEKLINNTLEEQTKKVRQSGSDKLKLAEEKASGTNLKNDGSIGNLVQYDIFRRSLDLTFQKLKEGVGFVYDFNKSLTEISIVTGKNQEQVSSLGKEYVALGKSMKVSSTEVAQASVEYYRQGLAQNEVDERMKQTIQFSKVANVGLKDSAEILTATVNSMEIDMKRATDVFTFMGDATATGKIVPLILVIV